MRGYDENLRDGMALHKATRPVKATKEQAPKKAGSGTRRDHLDSQRERNVGSAKASVAALPKDLQPKMGSKQKVEPCRHTVDVCAIEVEMHLGTTELLINQLFKRLTPVLDNNVVYDDEGSDREFITSVARSPHSMYLTELSKTTQAHNHRLTLLLKALDLPEAPTEKEDR